MLPGPGSGLHQQRWLVGCHLRRIILTILLPILIVAIKFGRSGAGDTVGEGGGEWGMWRGSILSESSLFSRDATDAEAKGLSQSGGDGPRSTKLPNHVNIFTDTVSVSEKNAALPAVVAGQPARTTRNPQQSPTLNCTAVLAALEVARGGTDNGTKPALVRMKDGNSKHLLLKILVPEVSSIFDHKAVPPGAPRPALLYGYSSRKHETDEKGLLAVTGPHLVKRWGVCASTSRNPRTPSVFVAELLPPGPKGGTEPISLEKYSWPAAETDPCRRFPVALGVVDSLWTLNEHGFVFDDWKVSQVRNWHYASSHPRGMFMSLPPPSLP
jgi:hypothetical protein